jgi:hypothetical protein
MEQTTAPKSYPVRTETHPDVKNALIDEQYRRYDLNRTLPRPSLMSIAAEWLEEIAKQKQELAKQKVTELA